MYKILPSSSLLQTNNDNNHIKNNQEEEIRSCMQNIFACAPRFLSMSSAELFHSVVDCLDEEEESFILHLPSALACCNCIYASNCTSNDNCINSNDIVVAAASLTYKSSTIYSPQNATTRRRGLIIYSSTSFL